MKNKILLVISSIILIVIFTPLFGSVYESLIGRKVTSWLFANPQYFEGFFISYSFFTTLFLYLFFTKRKVVKIFLVLLPIFLIQIGVWQSFLVSLVAVLVSLLLGFTVLKVRASVKKR